jgi:hypothetical protein
MQIQEPIEVLKARLNTETAKIGWAEIQRFFAKGQVFVVALELDLIDTAARMIHDDKGTVEGWLQRNLVAQATTDDAKRWHETDTDIWAVVVAPWVLVQEVPA